MKLGGKNAKRTHFHGATGRALLLKSGVEGSPHEYIFQLLVRSHSSRGQKINANFFVQTFFNDPSGHGRPR